MADIADVLIKTNLLGKINNLPHFKNEALLPLFEAVANSIQAIEESDSSERGQITIHVKRHGDLSLSGFESNDDDHVVGFEIEDNGVGFNDVNYDSFLTADTTHKLTKGCKGVGRFFWLKAFDKVEIESVYSEAENRCRVIHFSKGSGITEASNTESDAPLKTVVKLIGFKPEYRKQPSAYKTTHKIAQRILEHCLSYYIDNKAPEIVVADGKETISVDKMFDSIKDGIVNESFPLSGETFTVSHVKLYSTHAQMHNIVYCASSRDVKSVSISKHLGTSQHFDEDEKKFVYAVYVRSDYLDDHVDVSRVGFDLPETREPMEDVSVTMTELKNAVVDKSREYLEGYLVILKQLKVAAVANYVSNKNPLLRAVPQYCPEVLDEIEPNTSDEKIDEILYKYKGKAELRLKKQGEKLLRTQADSLEEIEEEYRDITTKLEDFQKDQLAGYITFRKMIIDLLEKKLEINEDGKYPNEDIVHDIIFPRKANTDDISFEDHNMWLIDERLAFHGFASSDKPLSQNTTSKSNERPDILVYSEVDDDKVARAVSVIELKKAQRTNFEEDPTRQLYRYVREVSDGKVKLPNGRVLLTNDTTRFYCYAICDITQPVREFAENNNYAQLKGELGYYLYNRNLNAHTEIIAFDKLVNDAKQRHRVFFEKLGI